MRRLYLLFTWDPHSLPMVAEIRSHRPASRRTRRRASWLPLRILPHGQRHYVEDPAVVVTGRSLSSISSTWLRSGMV